MKKGYIYVAFFVERGKLLSCVEGIGTRLERVIEAPHVTLAFRPAPGSVPEGLFGEKVRIRATGYGNDGKNEGVSVELAPGDPVLAEMADGVETPHITISVSRDGKPVNTAKLEFASLEEPFEIEGVFGGFAGGRAVVTCL